MPLHIDFPAIGPDTAFVAPSKRIHNEADVKSFQTSTAYARITAFIHFIGDAMPDTNLSSVPTTSSKTIEHIMSVLRQCRSWIEQCPPHTGTRRFGNMAFRDWHARLTSESMELLSGLLSSGASQASLVEVEPYFTGSFGSAQRLDYGTGHELSFFAFLCTLFQLGLLSTTSVEDAQAIGLVVYPYYLKLIQDLVLTYTLEPAGSHGVWGLDDHFAMPYLLGAAQLEHLEPEVYPTTASITSKKEVEEYRTQNLYFNAIGFINDVKKGPFWEHSPMLYDISGISTWSKISTGMRKMYNAEVLGKFPVVQHFPFGDVFFPFTSMTGNLTAETASPSPADASSEAAMTDLQSIRDQTQTLHVSRLAQETPDRDADTPVPEDRPTHAAKQKMSDNPTTSMPRTAAPWSSGTRAPTTGSISSHANQMSTPRIPVMRTTNMPPPTQTARRTEPQGEESKEKANVEGLESGIGVNGAEGTKAPFQAPRTIHPAVLESMRARGEST